MTSIEWTDETWNPTVGCSRVSTGCEHCYAERVAARGLQKAHRGLTALTSNGPRWTGEVRRFPDRLMQPLRWRKPRRVFVGSMSDLFHEAIPVEFLDQVFGVMLACSVLANRPHTFQVLTKRPERMARYLDTEPLVLVKRWAHAVSGSIAMDNPDLTFSEFVQSRCTWPQRPGGYIGAISDVSKTWGYPENVFPLRNVWLGTSCENRATLAERLPSLIGTRAAVRFLSIEPLLEQRIMLLKGITYIDLVIVGGESGPGARGCWIESIRSIVAQCRARGVCVFVKQLGAKPFRLESPAEPDCNCREFACEHRSHIPQMEWIKLKDPKGGDPDEWPEDLRVREMPECSP